MHRRKPIKSRLPWCPYVLRSPGPDWEVEPLNSVTAAGPARFLSCIRTGTHIVSGPLQLKSRSGDLQRIDCITCRPNIINRRQSVVNQLRNVLTRFLRSYAGYFVRLPISPGYSWLVLPPCYLYLQRPTNANHRRAQFAKEEKPGFQKASTFATDRQH